MATNTKREEKSEVRQLLDLMQQQNEKHDNNLQEMKKMLLMANEENAKRAKEIEILGKSIASLRVAGSLAPSEFNSVLTEDESVRTAHRRNGPNKPKIMGPIANQGTVDPEDGTDDDEEAPTQGEYERPTHSAKLSVQFIPVLKGRDDIGVERFIKKVHKARSNCREREELLDLIIATRITEDAERSIRHLDIDTYTNLYDALRQFVSIPTTADSARDRLRQVRQGITESVHSYIIRFRKLLNELTYALQYEHKNDIERRVAIDLENRRSVKIFILNLRDDIETRVSASSPRDLMEAQEAAFQAETTISEKKRLRVAQYGKASSMPTVRMTRNTQPTVPIEKRTPVFQQAERKPLIERREMKCFKCNQIGHLANQCGNFRVPSQQNLPPRRANHIQEETETIYQIDYESTQQPEDYQHSQLDEQLMELKNHCSSTQDQE